MTQEIDYDDAKPEEAGYKESDFKKNNYWFNDADGAHEHLLWSNLKEDYEQLTGATTVLEVLGKTLTWWAAELAAVECLESGEKIETIRQEYLEAVESGDKKKYIDALQKKYPIFKKARYAHHEYKNEAAEAGTDMHADLEEYVKDCIDKMMGRPFDAMSANPKVRLFSRWAHENVKRFLWSEGYCYDEMLFVGGISDCGAEMKDGTLAILDFKSSKEAFFNHFLQCAIYDLLIQKHGILDKNGNDMDWHKDLSPQDLANQDFAKYIVIPFGAKQFKAVENTNINNLKRAALAAIELYRAKAIFEK